MIHGVQAAKASAALQEADLLELRRLYGEMKSVIVRQCICFLVSHQGRSNKK